MRRLAFALVAAAGCATTGEPSSSVAPPRIEHAHPGYWIWFDGTWHLRATAAGHGHRYQGSVSAPHGAVRALKLTDDALASSVALVDGAVQFDFEPTALEAGFDATLDTPCARFDLYVDGKRAPARVHFGRHGHAPHGLPVEKCQ